jgi:toxin ParE1/3/4
MSQRRYRLTNRALDNLDGIASYIGERDVAAADRVIEALIGCFAKLAENPEIGTKRDDLRPGLRVFSPPRPAHNYVVVFYEVGFGVEINAVIHGARDWPELITRLPQ